jgi:alpha-L-fucosidase
MKRRSFIKVAAASGAAIATVPAIANNRNVVTQTNERAKSFVEGKEWFTKDKFGMFIHFGLYSIPAGVYEGKIMPRNWYAEWIRMQHNWPENPGIPKEKYDLLMKEFNPVKFNADEWIREAKNAGMKYFLITAKHHDGFALWPTKVDKYNVVDSTPFGRDILSELTEACHKYGLKFGFYYSHWMDWGHPGGALPPWPQMKDKQPSVEEFTKYWDEKCIPQVKELATQYNPSFFWFDTWGQVHKHLITEEKIDELIKTVKDVNKDCLVNSRIGSTWCHSKGDEVVDFLSMGDNQFPKDKIQKPWETSGTFNNSWGYHQKDFHWKSSDALLRNLIDNCSRGGNFQLNIGPKADGSFPPASVRRLREIGAWLAINGEAVYNTSISELPEPEWGRITERKLPDGGKEIFLFLYHAEDLNEINVKGLLDMPKEIKVLETDEIITGKIYTKGLVFEVPEYGLDENIAVIKVTI